MTASLLVLVPVALLVLISGFCFIGCVLNTHGLGTGDPPSPYTDYSGDVTGDASIVAYWPLNEPSPADPSGPITAHDIVGGHDGQYKHKGNDTDLFPIPGFNLLANIDSAPATGFLQLAAVSLVAGDAKNGDPNDLQTGMQTDGACVTVPFSNKINLSVFTVEAWVRPEWNDDQHAFRAIVDSRGYINGTLRGVALWSNETHHWEAALYDVNGNRLFVTAVSPVLLGQVAYLAFTFDGTNAALFVNGEKVTQPTALSAAYSPNTTQALVIGAGGPWLDDRVNGVGDNFFPILPFSGTIQDVAIYSSVLSDDTIKQRFDHGSGKADSAG
jgi:hypothetical protein